MDPKQQKTKGSFQTGDISGSRPETSRGSFRREPPVVPERVAVMKANYKQAWLFFLLGLCLIVAWGGVLRFALIRAFAVEDNENLPRTSSTFVAIAYEGISESEKEVTPEVFSEQMETLSEAGYNSITLQDVEAFYKEGELLPEKAVLLTFDHSRKSSYFDARKVLNDYRWRAVMFVWTKPILDEDPAALRWPYIRAMINSGSWEAGAQSQRGFELIPADSEGGLNNFMTSPKWLSAEKRYETPLEFEERLREDHEFAFNLIKEETGRDPIAFAFPYGDFGQYDERALLTRQLNMDLVDQYYALGFVLGNAALNTSFSNPHRLNRLLVDPEWDGQDLLARLEVSWPQNRGTNTEKLLSDRNRWQHDWGNFEIGDDKLHLTAKDTNTGAKVWINGTDLYRDFTAKFTMNIKRGQAGLFLRASKDGESHLYMGLGDAGEVWLRQKTPGMESITLGTSRYKEKTDGAVELEINVRGNQFFASAAGEPIFQEIKITRGENDPGTIGLSVWDPEAGTADLEVTEIMVQPLHQRLLTWDPIVTQGPSLAAMLNKKGYRYTILSAPWLRFGPEGRAEQVGWNPSYFSDLANVYQMDFGPEIIIDRSENIDATTAENIAERADSQGADAVYCNLSNMKGGMNIARVSAWLENLSAALGDRDVELLVSLPPSLQAGNTVTSLKQNIENLKIVIHENRIDEQNDFQPYDPRIVTWNHTSIDESPQPLYFQLSGGDTDEELLTTEVRSRLLWEQGLNSYEAGQFERAVGLWTRWSEMEPYNEKPPRYIGDVHRRKQDYSLAIEYYKRSLELNPGQLSLVITTAKLLQQFAQDKEGAQEMLGLYERLFPENTEIILAQAELLLNDDQVSEAEKKIKQVIDKNPEDITALSLLHDLLQTPEERVENLEKIIGVGKQRGMYTHFANTISNYELLIWPESWRLMDLVRERANEDHPDVEKYRKLLPRENSVHEMFQLGNLSDEWENSSFVEQEDEEGAPLYLVASPTGTEAALRLKRSETLQNGFIEAELQDARGFFWLYARRSEGNMVRFGFETAGKLYLQVWKEDEIITNISRDWLTPRRNFRLRLEIRGDAIFGYVNGEPAFGAPTQIPQGLNLGWWGMAPWASQFGVAEAVVREVAGGPLPVNLGLFLPETNVWTDEGMVEKLKPNTRELSLVSPVWFYQDTTGEVRLQNELNFPRTRLFTRYYKIRLYPMVTGAVAGTIDVKSLIDLAQTSKVDGLTLSFVRMPDENWFEAVEKQLVGTNLGLIALRFNQQNQVAEVREIGGAPSLQSGARNIRSYEVVNLSGVEQPVLSSNDPGISQTQRVNSMTTLEVSEADSGDTQNTEDQPLRVSKPVKNKIYMF